MTMKTATAVVLFFISVALFFFSIRSFLERGLLLNNAYLWASKTERETMNKKPYYRQSAVVFFLLGLIFMLNGFAVLWNIDRMFYIVGILSTITFVYAIVSAVKIEKQKNTR